MISTKSRYYILFVPYIAIVFILWGCEFEDPYVPDTAGSSSLTGRIVTNPSIDLNGSEVILRGDESFATIADPNSFFQFYNIPPGDYSLQVQKRPYLQDSIPISIKKSTDGSIGDIVFELKGAIVGTIPDDDIAIVHGEVEVIVYINGIPLVPEADNEGDFTINLSSTDSTINIRAATKITVYIDNIPYSAVIQNDGNFIVEFIPPGIYNDIKVKIDSDQDTIPIFSDGPIVVKSGQIRVIQPTQ